MDLLLYKLQTDEVFFIQTVVMVFLLCLALINLFQIVGLRKRLKRVVHNQDGMSIETVIHQYYNDIEMFHQTQSEIKARQTEIEEILLHCITKVGAVRFNAFGEVGGNQSFAIALLDQEDNGFVISSLYGRESSRFYGKPVSRGKSNYQLSTEEEEAIKRAKSGENVEM